MPDSAPDSRLSIAAAARLAGAPERSLFRAVEKGTVPSTKRDGVTVVEPADVTAWADRRAAARQGLEPQSSAAASLPTATDAGPAAAPTAVVMPGSLPSAHGGVAVGSGRPPATPALDGALSASLFAAFERRETPVEIVQRLQVPPQVVLAAHGQYAQLKAAATPDAAQARLDQLQAAIAVTSADADTLLATVGQLAAALQELTERVASIPVPTRETFRCACGSAGHVATKVVCTACGRDALWGYHPQRSRA